MGAIPRESATHPGTAIALLAIHPEATRVSLIESLPVTYHMFRAHTSMQYNDSIRQYNFLAGLGLGAVLGVGLARLALPQKKVLRKQVRGRLARRGRQLA